MYKAKRIISITTSMQHKYDNYIWGKRCIAETRLHPNTNSKILN